MEVFGFESLPSGHRYSLRRCSRCSIHRRRALDGQVLDSCGVELSDRCVLRRNPCPGGQAPMKENPIMAALLPPCRIFIPFLICCWGSVKAGLPLSVMDPKMASTWKLVMLTSLCRVTPPFMVTADAQVGRRQAPTARVVLVCVGEAYDRTAAWRAATRTADVSWASTYME